MNDYEKEKKELELWYKEQLRAIDEIELGPGLDGPQVAAFKNFAKEFNRRLLALTEKYSIT